jgi:hypothetical protein
MPARSAYLLLALAAAALPACEDLTAGQLMEDPGPPVLAKILIQDELPTGGRNVATDLLDQTPTISCSDRDPCPTGDKFSHPPCDLASGTCPDPLKPSQTPPAIGTPGTLAGNQIRLVWNKQLDPALEMVILDPLTGMPSGYSLADPTIIGLYDASGKEIPALKYWDPAGSPTLTSDLFMDPYGPALVIKQRQPFLPLASYEVRIRPDAIRDAQGQAAAFDINGAPVATSYPFTVEGFHSSGGALADFMDYPDTIDTTDVLAIKTNARFDASTLQVTVMMNGQPVETVAAPEFGTDPKACAETAASPQQINVFRVTGQDRTEWAEGDYTVSIDVVCPDVPTALFSIDPFGKTPYHDVPFKVMRGVDKDMLYPAELELLPWECAASTPPDMGPPPDLLIPPVDLGSADQAAPVDGGIDQAGGDGAVDGGAGD